MKGQEAEGGRQLAQHRSGEPPISLWKCRPTNPESPHPLRPAPTSQHPLQDPANDRDRSLFQGESLRKLALLASPKFQSFCHQNVSRTCLVLILSFLSDVQVQV